MQLDPVSRASLSDAVFDQLSAEILAGRLAPGDDLPGERSLCDQLAVNRGAVREALKRLNQAGLVRTRHGGATTVQDYRLDGGLDLLPLLVASPDHVTDPRVVRSLMELRALIGTDAARLAALRHSPSHQHRWATAIQRMSDCRDGDDLPGLQAAALDFWEAVVDASDNLAYRLAFNSLRAAYVPLLLPLGPLLRIEVEQVEAHAALCQAMAAGREDDARKQANDLLQLGGGALVAALQGALP
jgi:GntR family transcriptional regulator, transcriptional repressor for pyruvate dehydrogenase complex